MPEIAIRNDDLEDGMCIGVDTTGCPHKTKASPSTSNDDGGIICKVMRYHCERCFAVYRAKYTPVTVRHPLEMP